MHDLEMEEEIAGKIEKRFSKKIEKVGKEREEGSVECCRIPEQVEA